MKLLRITLVSFILLLVALCSAQQQSFAGFNILQSEVTKTDASLWIRFAGLASFTDSDPLKHVYTCIGAREGYTPHFAAHVPGLHTYIGITCGLSFNPLAKGDDRISGKQLDRAVDDFAHRNGIDPKGEFAAKMRDALTKGESPSFLLFVQVQGMPVDPVVMSWDSQRMVYSGVLDVTNVEPDVYRATFSFGFKGSRERIKLTIPVISWLFNWNPTVNRPKSEMESRVDATEFAVCAGDLFAGIDDKHLWLLTYYTRRTTFASHNGTSWSPKDTSGGYLEVIPIPYEYGGLTKNTTAGLTSDQVGEVMFNLPGKPATTLQPALTDRMIVLRKAASSSEMVKFLRVTARDGKAFSLELHFPDGRTKLIAYDAGTVPLLAFADFTTTQSPQVTFKQGSRSEELVFDQNAPLSKEDGQ